MASKAAKRIAAKAPTHQFAIAELVDSELAQERAAADAVVDFLRKRTSHEVHMNQETCKCSTCHARRLVAAYSQARSANDKVG